MRTLVKRGLTLQGKKDFELPPDWFHPGQIQLWLSKFDVILALWGTQAGKTVTGPWWCLRETARTGPGEGAVVGPNYSLLFKKVVPEFKKVWAPYGTYIGSPIPRFIVSLQGMNALFGSREERIKRWPGRDPDTMIVHFGYAENSDSLESMTLNWVWSDEAGQQAYKGASFEALERRLLGRSGRHLITTTPYVWNWLKTGLYDAWLKGEADHVDVLNIPSSDNPWESEQARGLAAIRIERARKRLQKWRFDMMYRGKFTRPAGSIYSCFTPKGEFDDDGKCTREPDCVPRFLIPRHWARYQGVDFGNVNMASNWAAMDPETSILYVYRTYHAGHKSVTEHLKDWNAIEESLFEPEASYFGRRMPLRDPICFGGAPSENDWRNEFSESGYGIGQPAVRDVEAGISRVYELIQSGRLKVFDNLEFLIGELETYSRKVNESGEPTAEIEDKASFHRADALRYLSFGVSLDIDQLPPLKLSRGAGNERNLPIKPEEEDMGPEEMLLYKPKKAMQTRRIALR